MPTFLGAGYELASGEVTNEELAGELGGSIDELVARTGIRSRRWVTDGEAPSDLARAAAGKALAGAGVEAGQVDFLIFATVRPDVGFPGSGCFLQDKLGCDTIGALDVRAQCAGFLFGLEIAEQFLLTGTYDRILLAAADVHSSGLDRTPRGRDVTPLFGDGAAAVLLGPGDDVLATAIHTDGRDFDRFWCEYPASRQIPRMTVEDVKAGGHYPKLDAERLRQTGPGQIVVAAEEVMEKAGIGKDAVSRFFFQHVLPDVADTASERLAVSDRTTVGGRTEGHIASASLPIALLRAREEGVVSPGDVVCLATAGSGANWGAALLRV